MDDTVRFDPEFRRAPMCMSFDQFAYWLAAARKAELPLCGICEDCTPEFQRQAKEDGTCSHPSIKFYRSLHTDELYGALQPRERTIETKLGPRYVKDIRVRSSKEATAQRKDAIVNEEPV